MALDKQKNHSKTIHSFPARTFNAIKKFIVNAVIPTETKVKQIELFRKYVVNLIFILSIVIMMLVFINEFSKNTIMIAPIDAPKNLKDAGYNEIVLANKLYDAINKIYRISSTEIEQKKITTLNSQDKFDIKLPESGISVRYIISKIKETFGYEPIQISAEIISSENHLIMTTRFSKNPPLTTILEKSENLDGLIDSLITNAAKYFYLLAQPYTLAMYYLYKQDLEGFENVMRYSLKKNENEYDYWAYYYLGKIYEDRMNTEQAMNMYARAIELNQDYLEPYYSMTAIYESQGNLGSAMNTYYQILKVDNTQYPAHLGLGNCLFRLERFKESIEHYDYAVNLEVQPEYVYRRLINYYIEHNNYKKARQILNESLIYYPTAGIFYLKLANIYEQDRDYENAIKTYHLALERNYIDPKILLELGKIHYLRKEYQTAQKYLFDAFKLDSANAEVCFFMGIIHKALSKRDSSVIFFRKAIELDTNKTAEFKHRAEKYIEAYPPGSDYLP